MKCTFYIYVYIVVRFVTLPITVDVSYNLITMKTYAFHVTSSESGVILVWLWERLHN